MAEKKLTVKQKKFVKEYVKRDGNGTKAALAVYNTTSEDVARSISSENLAKPSIREEIDKALIRHEITMDAAIKPIADGLRATKEFGENRIEIVDHSTRLKASGMALKLLGAEKQEQSSGTNIFVNGDANFDSGKYKK